MALPENIVCFQRKSASELNRPRHGRALHHRFVLIFALRTAATVCVDDRTLRLEPGEGLLVFPFQFHHYVNPQREALCWLFVTFELAEAGPMEPLRFRPFGLTPGIRSLLTEVVANYQAREEGEPLALLLGLLLARLRRLDPARPRNASASPTPEFVMQVNRLGQRSGESLRIRDLAGLLNVSPSHLRARFRASCGVSLGRHLRRLRLEKACGLLRLTANRVTEIADQCGFGSIYSFSRAFRAAFGQSPLAYRGGGGPEDQTSR